MSGNTANADGDDRLKFLAETAGIPVLEAFEHDSGELEKEQDAVRESLSAIEDGQKLLEEDETTDKLTDDELRFKATVD